MRILALDPGPKQTGYAVYENGRVINAGVSPNHSLVEHLDCERPAASIFNGIGRLAIEMIASYGMAVGKETFETCVWIGRFQQAWWEPEGVLKIYRKDVKLHLCHSMRAKDTNVRQALIDRLGLVGTKKNPGPLYGVSGHAWAALAVAVTAADLHTP
jgi:hypothetical protein